MVIVCFRLQDQTPAASALRLSGEQCGARGVFEDLAHAFVGLGRAFEVLLRSNFLPYVFGLWREWIVSIERENGTV